MATGRMKPMGPAPRNRVSRPRKRAGRAGVIVAACSASICMTCAPASAIAQDLSTSLTKHLSNPSWSRGERRKSIAAFYAARDHAPLWLDETGPTRHGAALIALLAKAGEDGLNPTAYRVSVARAPVSRVAAAELRLSESFLRYLSDLRTGAVRPGVRYIGVASPTLTGSAESLLRSAARARDLAAFAARHMPPHPAYRRLRAGLARYRAAARSGGWLPIPAGPDSLASPTDPRAGRLRMRLAATGDLPRATATGATVDAELVAGLRRFQARHDLPATASLTAATRAALNKPVSARIAAIRVNLERLRWVPAEVVDRSVMVDAAAFRLDIVEKGASKLATRVIVGKCHQRTPQFVTRMTGVQFNPFWNVPRSIARNEIMPRLRRDPGYLSRHRMRIVVGGRVLSPSQVDWSKMKGVPFQIRQQPGPGNALGRIRFLMPNPFNVYLHDTPSKRLFDRRRRAFSHGCVRVQDPGRVAAYLMRGMKGWDAAAVKRAMTVTAQRTVLFNRPLPVYVGYFTAWAPADGTVRFRADIYRRDARILRALAARRR